MRFRNLRPSKYIKNAPLPRFLKWSVYAFEDRAIDFFAQENKVFLASYPRSGTTWLQFMLVHILARSRNIPLDGPKAPNLTTFTKAHDNIPTVHWTHDFSNSTTSNPIARRGPDVDRLWIYGNRYRYRKARVVLLVRDPRDVVISEYHLIKDRPTRPRDFKDLSDFIRDPKFGFARVLRFYQIWTRNLDTPKDLLLIRYEELLEDGINVLESIIRFIGADFVSRSLIKEVYEFSHIQNLKKYEKDGVTFTRKGKSGRYKEDMSEEDRAFCNEKMMAMPEMFGYSPLEKAA